MSTKARKLLCLFTLTIAAAALLVGATLSPQAPADGTAGGTGMSWGGPGDDVGPLSPGPDLNASASDLTTSDAKPDVGQTLTLTLRVRNTGDDHALNVTVEVYDGNQTHGTLLDSLFVDNASAGSTTTLQTTWKATSGLHQIHMYLDTDNNVTEDSESNNVAAVAVDARPDLFLKSTDISFNKDPLREHDSVQLRVYVRNDGGATASSARVVVYLDDEGESSAEILNKTVNLPGESVRSVTETLALTIGDHTLYAVLDPAGQYDEVSEDNNEANATFTVEGVPDMALADEGLWVSSTMAGPVTVGADVFNLGNATGTGYSVGFYDGIPGSGTLIGKQPVGPLASGSWTAVTQSWTASAGTHHLYVRLESTDPLDPTGNNAIDRTVAMSSSVVAMAGPDMTLQPGVSGTFNGSGSYAHGSTISNYTWVMGDGTTLYGAVVKHNYSNTGSVVKVYTVTLTVRDSSSRTASDTVRVYVNAASAIAPTAGMNSPSGMTLEELEMNASTSVVNITQYIWDFGDGSTGSGEVTTHIYVDDGIYTVSLTVIDNTSAADTATVDVTVTNRQPVVHGILDIDTDVGVRIDLLALATDLDGSITSYLWDFGDGSTSTTRSTSHTWSSDGPHQARLNVTDDDGAVTSVAFWVNVTDVIPVAIFTAPSIVNEGQTVSVNGAYTIEPGDDIVKWEWDWEGDGTWDNTTGPSSYTTYGKPGEYNITLRVTDGEGSTNTTVRQLTVRNVAPSARGSIQTPAGGSNEGSVYIFNASVSSEPGDDIVRYFWDFDGDGEYEFNGTEPVVDYVPTKVGTFRPRLMVLDEDDTTGTYSGYWFRYSVDNLPPLVNDSVSNGLEGVNTTVEVDAYEPGNDLAEFFWDFDRDGKVDAVTEEPFANWTWWQSGIFYVWVNVTDIDHSPTSPSWGAGEIRVNITDVAPKPSVDDAMATEGEPIPVKVHLLGTELNVTLYSFDLDNDGTYDFHTTDQETMLTFTKTGNVRCRVKVTDTDGTEGFSYFNVFVDDVAPTLTASEFIIGTEGQELKVRVVPHEPGLDITGYAFDWLSDGSYDDDTDEPIAGHTFYTPGLKRITVRVTDEDGSSGTVVVMAFIANAPPVADAGTPPRKGEGEPVPLTAANSTEPGDDIVTYEWDYDGDGIYDHSTSDPEHEHAWDAPGNYLIRLRVTDADGTQGVDTTTVEIVNVAPVARFTVLVRDEDQESMLDASTSYDPGGIHHYEWNISVGGVTIASPVSESPTLPFTFDRKVDYTIVLTVLDDPDEGSLDSTTYTLVSSDVRTLPPAVSWQVPARVVEGVPFIVQASATDPHPADLAYFVYRWDFGDGTVGGEAQVTHTWVARELPYTLSLVVEDADGDESSPLTVNITVENLPPELSPVEPVVLKRGGTEERSLVASDLTEGDGVNFSLGGDAPDWVTIDGSKVTVSPGDDVEPGTYLVTVVATDPLGAEGTAFLSVLVTSDEAEAGVSMGTMIPLLVVLFIVFLVVAVLVSTTLARRGGGPPPKAKAEERGSDYARLYGEERPRRRVGKVEPERVDVDLGGTEEESIVPDGPYEVPEPPPSVAAAAEEVEEQPPMPSWMTPSKEEAAPAPARAEKPQKPREASPYSYRGAGAGVRYKGSGPPRR